MNRTTYNTRIVKFYFEPNHKYRNNLDSQPKNRKKNLNRNGIETGEESEGKYDSDASVPKL